MWFDALLILTTLFAVTESQVTIVADKTTVKEGETVVFTCTVPNFTDNIVVLQDGNTRAGCLASAVCNPTDTSAYTATKSGSNNVIFTILSFSKTRDVGNWVIRHGISNSNPEVLSAFIESSGDNNCSPMSIKIGCNCEVGCIVFILFVLAVVLYMIIHWCISNKKCKSCHVLWCCSKDCVCSCPESGIPCFFHQCICGEREIICCEPPEDQENKVNSEFKKLNCCCYGRRST